jgi:hypothetical protein
MLCGHDLAALIAKTIGSYGAALLTTETPAHTARM